MAVESSQKKQLADAVVEFQPLLTRAEVESLIHAVGAILAKPTGGVLTGTGTDFTGRQWIRGKITPVALRTIAEQFFSVQSVHSPLLSVAVWANHRSSPSQVDASINSVIDVSSLPSVGVVDTGVPSGACEIKALSENKDIVAPTFLRIRWAGSHGSFVASRVVFGDPDYSTGIPTLMPEGNARYYDINISGIGPGLIEDKSIYPALQTVVSTAPDVRVFNMSFDSNEPLEFYAARQKVRGFVCCSGHRQLYLSE